MNGAWENIPGYGMNITLPRNNSQVVLSYEIMVEGLRGQEIRPIPIEGGADTLQVRCLVDGMPYRYSSSMASTYDVDGRIFSHLSAVFVANLSANSHQISLQWKKIGDNIKKWVVSTSAVNAGYSMVAQADFASVNYVHESSDAYLYETDTWKNLSRNMTFSLVEDSSVTLSYSVTLQPQLASFVKDRAVEFISTRATVDGVAYTDSGETFGTNTWNPVTATVRGNLRLNLRAGAHTANLQWRKIGNAFKGWASSPSSLDGFAASRNLVLTVDKFAAPFISNHSRQILSDKNSWSVVGGNTLQINLIKESAVVVSYGLPVTQRGNPNLDANIWDPLAVVQTRLVVDGVAYTYRGSTVAASSQIIDSAFSQLALILPEGLHTISLQWKSNQVNWTTLNGINGGFIHSERLLTVITSENAKPSIFAPTALSTLEDTVLQIDGVSIGDIDSLLIPGMEVILQINIASGSLSFPNQSLLANDIDFEHMDNGTTIIFQDTIGNINQALSGMLYYPPLYFNGTDTINLTVYDKGNVGYGPALSDATSVSINVTGVDNPSMLTLPGRIYVSAANNFSVGPVLLEDVDSYYSMFSAEISVLCGSLSLTKYSEDLYFLSGNETMSKEMSFYGPYPIVQKALQNIVYVPNTASYSSVHPDIFSISITNMDHPDLLLIRRAVINFVRPSVQPLLRSYSIPRWSLEGIYPVIETGDIAGSFIKYNLFRDNYTFATNDFSVSITDLSVPNVTELVVYQSDIMAYAVSVKVGNFSANIIGSTYIALGEERLLFIQTNTPMGNLSDLICFFNAAIFQAVVVDDTTVACNVSMGSVQPFVTSNIAWLKLQAMNGSNTVESNYMTLFIEAKLEILDIIPGFVLRSGLTMIYIQVDKYWPVNKCYFGNNVSEYAFQNDQYIKCKVPMLSANWNFVEVSVGYGDDRIVSSSWQLQVYDMPNISYASIVLDAADGFIQLQIALNGANDTALLDSASSLSCTFNGAVVPYQYKDSNFAYCSLPISLTEIQDCCTNMSCPVTLNADSAVSNGIVTSCDASIFLPISSMETSEISSREFVVLQDNINAFITVSGELDSQFIGSSCIFGNTSISPLIISPGLLKCGIPPNYEDLFLLINSTGGVIASASIASLPSISSIHPPRGSSFGGTIVEITTSKNIQQLGDYKCHFNDTIVDAVVESLTTLSCLSPPHEEGVVIFQLSFDNILISSTYQFQFTPVPTINFLSPNFSNIGGGGILSVFGSGFGVLAYDSVYCKFHSHLSIATVLSDDIMQCNIPAHELAGSVTFQLESSHQIEYKSSTSFVYVEPILLQGIFPRSGVMSGGNEVIISGENFVPLLPIYCAFGSKLSTSLGIFHNKSAVSCIAPQADYANKVFVTISYENSSQAIGSLGFLQYFYIEPWIIQEVVPQVAFQNKMVEFLISGVTTLSMEDDIYCSLGNNSGIAVYLTSATFSCTLYVEASMVTPTLQVIVNGVPATMSNSINSIQVLPSPFVVSISQSSSSVQGGDIIILYGDGFDQINLVAQTLNSAQCKFGTVGLSVLTVFNDSTAGCTTPSSPELVKVPLTIFFTTGVEVQTGISFLLGNNVHISTINPVVVSSKGGDVIVVRGALFLSNMAVDCYFDSIVVSGRVLSETSFKCFVPTFNEEKDVYMHFAVGGVIIQEDIFQLTVKNPPVLTSFYPFAGPSIGGTNVYITGDGFSIDDYHTCKFNEVYTVAVWVNETTLRCKAPSYQVGLVNLTVFASGIRAESSGLLEFRYTNFALITDIYPKVGSIDGGNSVVMYGENFLFDEIATLMCNFGAQEVFATVIDNSTLECTAPPTLKPKEVEVFLSMNGSIYSAGAVSYKYIGDILILDVSPRWGNSRGGTEVYLQLAVDYLDQQVVCSFGNNTVVAAVYSSVNSVSLASCVLPALNPGIYVLSIDIGGYSITAESEFRVTNEVSIETIYPSWIISGQNQSVAIFGAGFSDANIILCVFGSFRTGSEIISDNVINCSPPNELIGEAEVGLEVDGRLQWSANHSVSIVVFEQSYLKNVYPAASFIQFNTTITIYGLGFAKFRSLNPSCVYGDVIENAVVESDEKIVCSSGVHSTIGESSVQLMVAPNQTISTTLPFEIRNLPTIYSFSPKTISSDGGDIIHVFGRDFPNDDSGLCIIGEVVTPALVVNSTIIECTASSIPVGMYLVQISFYGANILAEGQLSSISTGYAYELDPVSGPASGRYSIVVGGTNFSASDHIICSFGSQISLGLYVSSTSLLCDVPNSVPGEVAVSITMDGISVKTVEPLSFTFTFDSELFSIYPSVGPKVGSVPITIQGINFSPYFDYQCNFGEVGTPATFVSSEELSCLLPQANYSLLDTVGIYLTYGQGLRALGYLYFTYVDSIYVLGCNRAALSSDGDILLIFGESFPVNAPVDCVFGDVAAVGQIINSTSIQCNSPKLPPQENIRVSLNFGGYTVQSERVIVSIISTPVIDHISPNSIFGGEVVSVIGSNFVWVDSSYCIFGEAWEPAVVLNSGLLTCTAPHRAAGSVSLNVLIAGIYALHSDSSLSFVEFINPGVITEMRPTYVIAGTSSKISFLGMNMTMDYQRVCSFDGQLTDMVMTSNSSGYCVIVAPNLIDFNRSGIITVTMQNKTIWTSTIDVHVDQEYFDSIYPTYVMSGYKKAIITVRGSFVAVGEYQCNIPGNSSSLAVFINEMSIQCMVELDLIPQKVALTVVSSISSQVGMFDLFVVTKPNILAIHYFNNTNYDGEVVASLALNTAMYDVNQNWKCQIDGFEFPAILSALTESILCSAPLETFCNGNHVSIYTADHFLHSDEFSINIKPRNCNIETSNIFLPDSFNSNKSYFGLASQRLRAKPAGISKDYFSMVQSYLTTMVETQSNLFVMETSTLPRFTSLWKGRVQTTQSCLINNVRCSELINSGLTASSTDNFLVTASNLSSLSSQTVEEINLFALQTVSPRTINAANGTWVTVFGKNFDSSAHCKALNSSAVFTTVYVSKTQLSCYIPPMGEGDRGVFTLAISNFDDSFVSYGKNIWYDKYFDSLLSPLTDGDYSKQSLQLKGSSLPSSICLSPAGCDLSYLFIDQYRRWPMNVSFGSFPNSSYGADILLETAYAIPEPTNDYKIISVSTQNIGLPCEDDTCYIEYEGYGFEKQSYWCVIVQGQQSDCYSSSEGDRLICYLPSVVKPGLSNIILMENCTKTVYSSDVNIFLNSDRSNSILRSWSAFSFERQLKGPSIASVEPTVGWTDGSTTIKLTGKNLGSLSYCSFIDVKTSNQLNISRLMIDPSGNSAYCYSPVVSQPLQSRVVLINNYQMKSDIKFSFEFVEKPIVQSATLSSQVNSTIVIFGQGFSRSRQGICKVVFTNGNQVILTGKVYTEREMHCLGFTARYERPSGLAVSFNGIDFTDNVEFSINSIATKFYRNYLDVPQTESVNVSLPQYVVISPDILHLSCGASNLLPFNIGSNVQSNLSCYLNGELLDSAPFLSQTFALCSLPTLQPGKYTVELVNSVLINPWKLVTNIFCEPDPKILSASILPQIDPFITVIEFKGIYISSNLDISCSIDALVVQARIDNNVGFCVFKEMLPLNKMTTFIIGLKTRVLSNYPICFSEKLLTEGGNLQSAQICSINDAIVDSQIPAQFEAYAEVSHHHIYSLKPRSGLVFGGTMVRLNGEMIERNSKILCHFGDKISTAFATRASSVICRAPASIPGNVSVSLSTVDGSNIWSHAWFYYYPPLSILSFEPNRLRGYGNTVLTLRILNLPDTMPVFCHVNQYFVVDAISHQGQYVTCVIPSSQSKAVNISVGSQDEVWSNTVTVSTDSASGLFAISPLSGNIAGNTSLQIFVPGSFNLGDPICMIGHATTQGSFDKNASVVNCLTPAGQGGLSDVYLLDGNCTNCPMFYAGTYTYTPAAQVFSSLPALLEQGKNATVRLYGNNFIDSSELRCLIDNTPIAARWLSSELVICELFSNMTSGKAVVSVSVSNNGLDVNNVLQIKTFMTYRIKRIWPNKGFILAGSSIFVEFYDNVQEQLYCSFSGVQARGFILDNAVVVFKAPAYRSGLENVTLSNYLGTTIAEFTYEFIDVPVLKVMESQAILRSVRSEILFESSVMLDSYTLFGRFRTPDGSIILADCSCISSTQLKCSNIYTDTLSPYVILELSTNGEDFISNIASVQVFTPPNIFWVDPLWVFSVGGDVIKMGISYSDSLSAMTCVFNSSQSGDEIAVDLQILSASMNLMGCSAPKLSSTAINYFMLKQFSNILYGPKLIMVAEKAAVKKISPSTILMGSPQRLTLDFTTLIQMAPRPALQFQNVVYPLSIINPFQAVGSVVASNDQDSKLYMFYPSVDNLLLAIGELSIKNYGSDITVNSSQVLGRTATNVTFISHSCLFDDSLYCSIQNGLAELVSTDNCSLICAVQVKDLSEDVVILSLCYGNDNSCLQPLFSARMDILSSMSVVSTSPSFGSTLGGMVIEVHGSGFVNDGSLKCVFGDKLSTAIFNNSNSLQCLLPESAPGIVAVNLQRKGIIISSSLATFEYLPLLSRIVLSQNVISSLGGTILTASVQDILDSTKVLYCRFDEVYVPAIVVNSSFVTCESPRLLTTSVQFALSAYKLGDISSVYQLEVAEPKLPIFVDTGYLVAGYLNNITLFFGDLINEADNISCQIDQELVPSLIDQGTLNCNLPVDLMEGSHTLSLISFGVKYFEYQFDIRQPYRIESIWPTIVWAGQPASIMIDFESFDSFISARKLSVSSAYATVTDGYSSCCFAEYKTPASLLSANQWQCFSPKINMNGLTETSQLQFGMAFKDGFCQYSNLVLTFYPPLVFDDVENMNVTTGSIFGGDHVLLKLKHDIALDKVYCRFGMSITTGQYEPVRGITCISPPSPPGTTNIDVSVNGIDFQHTGKVFNFMLPTPAIQNIESNPKAYVSPVIYYLDGNNEFLASGQMFAYVHGVNFFPDSVCKMGGANAGLNSVVLTSLYMSSNELRCTLPAHIPGTDSLFIQNFNGNSSNSVNVTFVVSPSVGVNSSTTGSSSNTGSASITTNAVSPTFGPRNAGTLLSVSMLQLANSSFDSFNCLIGDEWTPAYKSIDNTLSCLAPPSNFIGQVKVQVGTSDHVLLNGWGFFEYLDDPIAYDIEPKRGGSESSLVITGQGFKRFSPSLSILYLGSNSTGNDSSSSSSKCVVLSDIKLLCQVPSNLAEGDYPIVIDTNGQHIVQTGLIYTQMNMTTLYSLWPLNGPALRGGTILSIFGTGFPTTIDVSCLIDNVMIPANVLNDDHAECRVPSHKPGLVKVSLLSDGIPIHPPESALEFRYVPDVSVYHMYPNFGYTSGDIPIFVLGNNFLNTSSLGCKFADMPSRAVFINNNTLICILPSTIGKMQLHDLSIVPVEVTVNGLDYSESNKTFAYRQPCDKGFFCPGIVRQLCPNGTYCPENSRNFTLCDPGYFQPMEGQTGCVLCPVGYICPDLGMSRPINCPAGMICDSMGLRTSNRLCPSGSYCLNTTKASAVSAFEGVLGWYLNNVTGVVSFNSSLFNYSYHAWPAPAVGASRAQAPPALTCDGLVCAGGTTAVLAEAPLPCPIGHYCRSGVVTEIPIPKNFSSPQRCFDGYFCPRGSTSPEGAGPCPNGYFCPNQLDAIICPPGHYCPGVGNRDPIECYPGTYNPFEGMANCTVCPTGHICPGWGLLLPEPCPAGFVCMSLGLSYPVVVCPAGYRCAEGTLTLDPSDSTSFKPIICKAGQFCLGGVASTINVEWIQSQPYGVSHPQTCSEGTYCQEGAYLPSGTGLCFNGHYCPPNTSFPIATPLGNFASGLGSVAPTLCYPGTYAPLLAQETCNICPSGHTCISYGTYIPTICNAGTYRSQIDSLTCTDCPTGTYSYETGSPDLSLCLPCPEGRVCGTQKMTTLAKSVQCPAGYVCGYGTDRSNQFSHYSPAGYSTDYGSAPSLLYSLPCSAGFYCARGIPTYNEFAGKCPVGSFCPEATPVAPSMDILCPEYTTSLSNLDAVEGCRIADVNVCDKNLVDSTDPTDDVTYYDTFSYTLLDGSGTTLSFDSSLSVTSPTGEIRVVKKVHPMNQSASFATWQNDTIEAFRACPQYGSGTGGDVITIIGRNFIDTDLNFCKFRACYSANLGRHLRRCKNQMNLNGRSLPVVGNISETTYITRAKYISPTRLECVTPEFAFDRYDIQNATMALNNYECLYIDNTGSVTTAGLGNFSYVRLCDSLTRTCANKPSSGYEYFTSLTLYCTDTDIADGFCSNNPEIDYMFNPCISAEVAVEVTNDGEHYSGGDDLNGFSILSTVRYLEGGVIYRNFKNLTINATLAVFTYVYPEHFYNANPDILKMEKAYCSLSRYMEEAPREREEGWYLLKLNEVAHVSIDLTFLPSNFVYGEHYRLAIFVQPSRCDSNFCSSTRVRLPPEEYLPCQKPMPFSYWFSSTTVPKNVVNNLTVYALDDLIFKVEVHLLYGLYQSYGPLLGNSTSVIISSPSRAKSTVGLSLPHITTRNLSQYVSFTEQLIPMQYFFCAVVYQTDSNTISQPLNLPPLYSDYQQGRALIMNNVSDASTVVPLVLDPLTLVNKGVQFWMMPATTPDESKELLDAYFETFQQTTFDGTSYQFNFNDLLLPYLPYFSNCYTFDSYIPIWLLVEGQECELPNTYPKSWHRYKFPALPDQDDIKFVGPFDFFADPISDWCERTLTCNYEEDITTQDNTYRWYEAPTGTSLFQLIRYPIDYYGYTGRQSTHISQNDGGGALIIEKYALLSSDNFIPVVVDHTIGDAIPGCIYQCYARSYLLTIEYYQEDLYNKRIIKATLAGDQYDFNQANTQYQLQVSYYGLSFLDLILNFAFTIPIFIVIFIFVGILTVVIAYIGWIICRLTTLLQNPPQLRVFSMLALTVPPPIAGVSLAVVLIWVITSIGNWYINGYFYSSPLSPVTSALSSQTLDLYPLTYNALGTSISTSAMQTARYGRIGSMFFMVGFFSLITGANMYFPRKESKRELEIAQMRTPLAKKRTLWSPVLWKQLNFILSCFVLATILTLVVQISYWTNYGTAFYTVIIMLEMFREVMLFFANRQLNDAILAAPLACSWVFVSNLIAFGAPDFLTFLLQNFVGFAVDTFQRLFINYYLDFIFSSGKFVVDFIVDYSRRLLPKYLNRGAATLGFQKPMEEEKDYRKRAVEGVTAEGGEGGDSESVEPILEYYADICNDGVVVYYFPFFVFLLMQYRQAIYIPIAYAIRNSDMIIYMVYQLFLCIFQPLIDLINHSQCELFYGWKIYEYLVYSRYRFLQRETRWKGMENTLDECIEEKLRRMDQMCFSSQYFLMLTIVVNGIIYIILAYQVWLNINYSPFSDSGFFLLFAFMASIFVLMRYGLLYLAVQLKIWRIKHENTAWHLAQKEEDELDVPGWEDIKGASAEAFLMNQRITSETFRYKFLNYNRTWLINQLPQLLTPRTLRRSRPYLINQLERIINAKRDDISSDSEDEKEEKFGPVALTTSSRNIIRYWLGKARRRIKLRLIVEPLIKRARGVQCEQCLSRKQLQVEYEVDLDTMASMYDKSFPGDEEGQSPSPS